MLAGFPEFKVLSDGKKIKMMNYKFNDLIRRYNFNLIQNQIIDDQRILRKINESTIIMLDYYFTTTNKFYIICFENELIILNNSHQTFIKFLFSRQNEHKLYFVPKFNFILRKNRRLSFFEEEVNNLKDELRINPIHGKVVKSFWEIIKPCLSAYIIKKCHHTLIENRRKTLDGEISYISQFFLKDVPLNQNANTRTFYKDEFVVLRIIKTTQSSTIKLCYHIKNEQIVVIKSFQREITTLKSRELENYKKIKFIFIPKFYGEIVDTNENSLVIEFIEGPTLQSIKKLKLSLLQKINIIHKIITTFVYLHQYNFIYRDLKPSNLIFVEPYYIFLIDFDQMISYNDLSFSNDFLSQYVAPELQQKNCKPSAQNDIYSIGKIIYYIFKDDIENQNTNKKLKYFIIALCECCFIEEPGKRPSLDKLSIYLLKIFNLKDDNSVGENLWQLGLYYKSKDINKSIYYLTLAADILNINALNELGNIYSDYNSGIYNLEQSIHYFTISADNNDQIAQLALGLIYLCVKHNNNKAIKYLTLSSNQNNPIAQYNLGSIYYYGINVPRDNDKALYYFQLAANQNHHDAQYHLGLIYRTNSIYKAIDYYKLAADSGHSQAQFELGFIYYFERLVNNNIRGQINDYLIYYCSQMNVQDALKSLDSGKCIKCDINKAIHYLNLSAAQNNINALSFLGIIYLYENPELHDINKAIHYFVTSAKLNDLKSQIALGIIYIEGKYIARDVSTALYYLNLAAKNPSCSQIEYYLLSKIFMKININYAIYFYKIAADQNYQFAQFDHGLIYYEGKYIKRDINKSIYYLTQAANQNNQKAQALLGEIYYNGQYLARDINKSIFYLTKAANQNNQKAQVLLGEIYYSGQYLARDINKSIFYLTKAANQNDQIAQVFLGEIYYFGEYIARDINKSIFYLTKAANQNNQIAQVLLGEIYYIGKYIGRDINKSIYYLTKAANQNNEIAQITLLLIYYYGNCVKRDINKSMHYLKLLSNANNDTIQYKLGFIYYEGKYIKRDINKAIHYFRLSACQNNASSQYYLGLIYYEGKYVKQNINKALNYFNFSAEKDFRDAQLILGDIYLEGKYVHTNIKKSIYYYKSVSSFYNEFAKNNLGVIYKNGFNVVDINYPTSKIFFEEAIREKNDYVSMYNLANLLLDEIENEKEKSIKENKKYDECKELLIKSSKFVPHSVFLFCLILIKEHGFTDLKHVENEMQKYYKDHIELNDKIFYEKLYQYFRKNDLVYINKHIYSLDQIKLMQEEYEINMQNYAKNIINKDFYDGFGNDLLQK